MRLLFLSTTDPDQIRIKLYPPFVVSCSVAYLKSSVRFVPSVLAQPVCDSNPHLLPRLEMV